MTSNPNREAYLPPSKLKLTLKQVPAEFWRTTGEFWAEHGFIALLVDSFGPRGYPSSFPKGSYEDRPSAVSEQTVRPLDAYGALRYLCGRGDIIADRIGVAHACRRRIQAGDELVTARVNTAYSKVPDVSVA